MYFSAAFPPTRRAFRHHSLLQGCIQLSTSGGSLTVASERLVCQSKAFSGIGRIGRPQGTRWEMTGQIDVCHLRVIPNSVVA